MWVPQPFARKRTKDAIFQTFFVTSPLHIRDYKATYILLNTSVCFSYEDNLKIDVVFILHERKLIQAFSVGNYPLLF